MTDCGISEGKAVPETQASHSVSEAQAATQAVSEARQEMTALSIDEQLLAMAGDWGSPIGIGVREATDELAAAAKATAPVSRRGSKYSPPGAMKAATGKSKTDHLSADGTVLGLVGTPRYPGNFIIPLFSAQRKIRNGWSRPGTIYGEYEKTNLFLTSATETVKSLWSA